MEEKYIQLKKQPSDLAKMYYHSMFLNFILWAGVFLHDDPCLVLTQLHCPVINATQLNPPTFKAKGKQKRVK